MADLDYAYLADYATVENGRLSAIGASFTHMFARGLPVSRTLGVAGRVRVPVDEPGFELRVAFRGPDNAWEYNVDAYVTADEVMPYDGKRGVLFAVQTNVPLTATGLYTVDLSVDDEHVRTLKFDVSLVEQ